VCSNRFLLLERHSSDEGSPGANKQASVSESLNSILILSGDRIEIEYQEISPLTGNKVKTPKGTAGRRFAQSLKRQLDSSPVLGKSGEVAEFTCTVY
jgi:hypothetical protein